MKKNKIVIAVLSIMLCVVLTGCTTVVVSVPAGIANTVLGTLGVTTANNTGSDTGSATSATEAPAQDITEAPAQDVTAVPAQDATAAPTSDTPATNAPTSDTPATEAPTSQTSSSSVPSTKDEIIKYYVDCYNKIATEAKTVTRTYDYTSNYNNILEINNNSTLEELAGTLMNKFMVETTDPIEMTASDLPPVGVTKLSISSDKISDAKITDKGSTYEVVLKSTGTDSNWEIDSVAGQGSAGCIGPLLRSEDVSGAAGSLIKFEGLHSWYGTASVVATIDKATNHITSFHFSTPSVLHFDKVTAAVVVKVENCNIGLLFTQDWTVAY